MPTARKTKAGTWRCQAFDYVEIIDGKKKYHHRSFTASTKWEAERRAVKRAGLPSFRFHDLRAYSVSIAHAIGIPDSYLMRRGGWSSPDTYRKTYRRVIGDEDAEITAKLNEHFEKLHS